MEESNIKEYFYETNPLTKEIFSSIGDKVCLVGGAIVDCILGREPQDYDLSFFSQQALDDTIILLQNGINKRRYDYYKTGGVFGVENKYDNDDMNNGIFPSHYAFAPTDEYDMVYAYGELKKRTVELNRTIMTDQAEILSMQDSLQSAISLTNTTLLSDSETMNLIDSFSVEGNGWCISPTTAGSRYRNYVNRKGFKANQSYMDKIVTLFKWRTVNEEDWKPREEHFKNDFDEVLLKRRNNEELPERYKLK